MNKIQDLVIATQFSTVCAAVCTYIAHLIASGAVLNENWDFSVYLLLVIATIFMLAPHLLDTSKPSNKNPETITF